MILAKLDQDEKDVKNKEGERWTVDRSSIAKAYLGRRTKLTTSGQNDEMTTEKLTSPY